MLFIVKNHTEINNFFKVIEINCGHINIDQRYISKSPGQKNILIIKGTAIDGFPIKNISKLEFIVFGLSPNITIIKNKNLNSL